MTTIEDWQKLYFATTHCKFNLTKKIFKFPKPTPVYSGTLTKSALNHAGDSIKANYKLLKELEKDD